MVLSFCLFFFLSLFLSLSLYIYIYIYIFIYSHDWFYTWTREIKNIGEIVHSDVVQDAQHLDGATRNPDHACKQQKVDARLHFYIWIQRYVGRVQFWRGCGIEHAGAHRMPHSMPNVTHPLIAPNSMQKVEYSYMFRLQVYFVCIPTQVVLL